MPSPVQIEIRRLTGDDAAAFYRLRLEALEQEPHAFSSSPQEHRTLTLDAIKDRLGSDSGNARFVLGAFVDDRLVGMSGFFQEEGLKSRHKGRIWGVYVTQEWRRKGVARVLLAELLERARSIPELEQVTLSVATAQTAASRLYQSLGFQVYGRESRAIKITDQYEDEDLMMLRLRG